MTLSGGNTRPEISTYGEVRVYF